MRIAPHPLIHDWNHDAAAPRASAMLDDETLRDGLQSPSVRTPSVDERIQILHQMDALGIDTADIGLPGAGPKIAKDVEKLARAIVDSKLRIRANCAARTMVADIRPIFLATRMSAIVARLMQETTEFCTSPEDFPSEVLTSIRSEAGSVAYRRLVVMAATTRFLILAW